MAERGKADRAHEELTEARSLIAQEIRALTALSQALEPNLLTDAVEAILTCRGLVMATGSGTSSSIARRAAHLLTCAGAPAMFLDAGQAQHGYSAVVRPMDLILAFSRGGETDEVNGLLRIARGRGARVISILEAPESTMAGLSDLVLPVHIAPEDDACGALPLASTLVHAALADVLCAAIMRRRGFDEQRFAEVHPGGAVGKRLRGRQAPPPKGG